MGWTEMGWADKVAGVLKEYNRIDARKNLDDNLLLETIYDSFCTITQNEDTFKKRIASPDKDKYTICSEIASELFAWYKIKYGADPNNKGGKGSQGQRTVSISNTYKYKSTQKDGDNSQFGKYGFSQYYSEYQFHIKFASLLYSESGQPYMDFILHCCVAFFVSPKKIDELLLHYGFSKLHVRNVHHMAIYTVLNSAQSMNAAEICKLNPFIEIEKLYIEARKLLNDGTKNYGISDDDFLIKETKTNMIHDILMSNCISKESMLHYVSANKSLFSMRHSLILRDCWKYSRLYTHLYCKSGRDTIDRIVINDEEWDKEWSNGEEQYSLYNFYCKYCLQPSAGGKKEYLSKPSYKNFKAALTNLIDSKWKHPSREFMIIIWLYNYCFASMNDMIVKGYTISRLSKSFTKPIDDGIERDYSGLSAKVKENYNKSTKRFSVSSFIFNKTSGRDFDGHDVIDNINKHLDEYGWGQLDGRRKFDFYILSISHIKIRDNIDHDKRMIVWQKGKDSRYEEELGSVDNKKNVPEALVVITEYFDEIQKEMKKKKELAKSENTNDCYPLGCSVYEQI